MQRLYSKILRKNLIFLLIPLFLILTAVFVIGYLLRSTEGYYAHDVQSMQMVEKLYSYGFNQYALQLEDNTIKHTGFYAEEGKERKGEYVYLFENQKIYFLLLRMDTVQNLEEDGQDHLLYFTVREDPASVDYILSEMADEELITKDELKKMSSVLVGDELRYPYTRIKIAYNFIYGVMVFGMIVLLYSILAMIKPYITPAAAVLSYYGKRKKIMEEIDYEIRRKLVYAEEDVIVTENYILVCYAARTDVIRRRDITAVVLEKGRRRKSERQLLITIRHDIHFYIHLTDPEFADHMLAILYDEDEDEEINGRTKE